MHDFILFLSQNPSLDLVTFVGSLSRGSRRLLAFILAVGRGRLSF